MVPIISSMANKFIGAGQVKDHNQFTVFTAMRQVLKVKEGDHLAAFEVEEYPDCVLLKKLETTVEPVVKRSR